MQKTQSNSSHKRFVWSPCYSTGNNTSKITPVSPFQLLRLLQIVPWISTLFPTFVKINQRQPYQIVYLSFPMITISPSCVTLLDVKSVRRQIEPCPYKSRHWLTTPWGDQLSWEESYYSSTSNVSPNSPPVGKEVSYLHYREQKSTGCYGHSTRRLVLSWSLQWVTTIKMSKLWHNWP